MPICIKCNTHVAELAPNGFCWNCNKRRIEKENLEARRARMKRIAPMMFGFKA